MSDDRDPKDAPERPPAAMSEEALRARLRRARTEAADEAGDGVAAPGATAADAAPTASGGSGGGEGQRGGGDGPGDDDEGPFSLDEVDLRDALRGALRPPPGAVAPRLLPSVQRKIRIRSRGKFYGDGWSTADRPRSTYIITSIVMLAVIALVFLALVPWGAANLR